jgi:hypothetical protein
MDTGRELMLLPFLHALFSALNLRRACPIKVINQFLEGDTSNMRLPANFLRDLFRSTFAFHL